MRGSVAIVVACLASGCGFSIEFRASDDGGPGGGDGSGSGGGDGGFGCYGTGMIVVCPLTQPPPSFDVTVPVTLDTNVAGNCTAVSGTNVAMTCVVLAEEMTISADVRGIGMRPLVFVATKSMKIQGRIDVASRDGIPGAGFTRSACANGIGPSGIAGGAGGSFGGQGGRGGNGGGGTPGPSTIPTSLRGGCHGQDGAGPFSIGGDGADGGGGFYAIAGMSIELSGSVNASGEGGDGGSFGGTNGGGGGGGGSGGMVVLDAPAVAISGELFANGGGGGGGSSGVSNAGNGHDPTNAQTMPAGGTNATGAGRGGRGALGALVDGGAGENEEWGIAYGGGGGGGGVGFTRIYGSAQITGQISPALTPP